MDSSGFSLIELVAVIGIAAVLMAMATLNFNQWSSKYDVERQTREIYSDIMQTRLSAMQQKQNMRIFFGPTQYNVVNEVGNIVTTKRLNHEIRNGAGFAIFNINTNNVRFDNRGFATNSFGTPNMTLVVLPVQNSGDGCIIISDGLTSIGRIDNAGNCIAR